MESPELWKPFQKLIWLHHCFVKAIKSVYLAWFISPDRLANTFQHAFPCVVRCAGIYLFFLSSWNAPIRSSWSHLKCYLLCEVPPSHFPRKNYSPLCFHKTQLHLSYSTVTRYYIELICLVNTSRPRTMIYASLYMSAHHHSWWHILSAM